jgi:tetratricopeptide (TPR) repeat protein
VDADVRARLQALGYVGATPTSLARQNLGEILYRRGRFDAAERELRAVVEAQPQNLAAHLWLAKTLREAGRPREALRIYERALALPGGVGAALVEGVDVAVQAKQTDDARRIMAGVRPGAADQAPLHTARGVVAQADGDRATAERELRAALASDPSSFDALSRLLDLLIAGRRPREFLPFAKDAAQRGLGSPRHLALYGETLLACGDYDAAAGALRQALDLAPDSIAIRVDIARAELALGHAERVLETLRPAPASADVAILLGAAYAKLGRWSDAAAQYRGALDKGGASPPVLNGLAWAEIQQGRKAEAAEVLARSLALDDKQPEIRQLLAEIRGGSPVAHP